MLLNVNITYLWKVVHTQICSSNSVMSIHFMGKHCFILQICLNQKMKFVIPLAMFLYHIFKLRSVSYLKLQ